MLRVAVGMGKTPQRAGLRRGRETGLRAEAPRKQEEDGGRVAWGGAHGGRWSRQAQEEPLSLQLEKDVKGKTKTKPHQGK